jgi:hypothetical protein
MPEHVDEVMLAALPAPPCARRVAEIFGREPRVDIDPMEVPLRAVQLRSCRHQRRCDDRSIDVAACPASDTAATAMLIDRTSRFRRRTQVFSTARMARARSSSACQRAARVFATNTLLRSQAEVDAKE